MRVAVLDDHQSAFGQLDAARRLHGHEVVTFADPVTGDALVERLDGFDAVVLLQQRTALPAEVVARLRTVRLVSQTGRNTGHLDLAALAARRITVCAGGAGSPAATAELTWGLVLSALRHLPAEVARLRDGQWQGSVGTSVAGRVLGVYGYGRIGSRVAAIGRAFDMRVVCWGRSGSQDRAREAGYQVASSREAFFAGADVLCVHLPLNGGTRGIVTAADLSLMKPAALFVNTSRAGLVEPGALAAAVAAGRPGRAAVDVFDTEPVLDAADALLALPGVTATPHLGYVTWDVLESLYGTAVDQVLAFAAGDPVNVVG
ncbi:D-2-hydroxyacid dehydrogenase family protein [Phycicoccus sp. Soil748]|uniref:D-2-hydroxyacid dehydrogenase family protein n=1 Tax=Phycicoccus sp. Soil748 TaxID=1736397 RepID=UPI00070339F2|nr:D-2-hydroxyacid dehydrogenase family protein [Phycicoccus sp. Soil748]KRE56172.1 3-phosphoglycerate dehydrogenase [Phycicoccus sp. Soil748]